MARHHLVAVLLHRRGAARERDLLDTRRPSSRMKKWLTLSRLLNAPSRGELEIVLPPFPAIFGAADPLARVGDLVEAAAGVGRSVGEAGSHVLSEGRVAALGEADQLQPAADESEFIIAAELVGPAVLVVADQADSVGEARADPFAALAIIVVEALDRSVEIADGASRAVPGELDAALADSRRSR